MSKYTPFTNAYEDEQWQDIPGYDGQFQVSSFGRIKSLPNHGHKNSIILATFQSGGKGTYPCIKLQFRKQRKTFYIHDLVASAFIGVKPAGYEVNHIDSNPLNNHFSNLEYLTHADNVQYTVSQMRHCYGFNHNFASLTQETIDAVKAMKGHGLSQRKVAAICGVAQSTVGLIWDGRFRKYG